MGVVGHMVRLLRAGRLLARLDGLLPPDFERDAPPVARMGRALLRLRLPFEAGDAGPLQENGAADPLSAAMRALGPSYIKLGQFLATRPDLIGPDLAGRFSALQDRLAPFSQEEAVATVEAEFGVPLDHLFADFGPAVAAASIAQVHKARAVACDEVEDGGAPAGCDLAVKILRPGIEAQFARDLDSFFWAARLAERWHKPVRRLRPVASVQTLADSVTLEMDLRLEAAALSEMAENTRHDTGFRVPAVDWQRTSQRVLTLEWVDGIKASDRGALVDAGHDMAKLGTRVIQSFLTHALRDGFFHADMHQGNLFVEPDGTIVAVDLGIMGRLDAAQRKFLADILFGFIQRDYTRVAEVHFEAGFVPRSKPVHGFAQALRAIGEPIFGRSARDVSMGRLLAQLFQVTDQFDMATRPELLLLQKTMVVVEGVARHFDPDHNIWDSAEPVLKDWMENQFSPEARLQEAATGAAALGRAMSHFPELLTHAERAAHLLQDADESGLKLHPETAEAIGKAQSRQDWQRGALWVGAGALVLIALSLIF